MKNIRTATVTWITYRNFGTYLQAYALQKTLNQLGYNNAIISDKKIIDSFYNVSLIRKIIRKLIVFIKNKSNKSAVLFDRFIEEHLVLDNKWKNVQNLHSSYDIFLAGSDQIWSPAVRFDAFYYLGFTNKKKIAYGPSLGTYDYPIDKLALIKPYLQQFSFLSVREQNGVQILEDKLGLKSECVLDPTLLLSKSDWDMILSDYNKNKDFVLCYLLTYNENYLKLIKTYSVRKNLKLKIFATDSRLSAFADEMLYSGPLEFVNEIKNCKYFFTDSFHGSIFSILYEKKFFTFKRFVGNADKGQNSRIESLFNLLGIKDRFISNNNFDDLDLVPDISYKNVSKKLMIERQKSLSYLQHALNTVEDERSLS